ncbi:hypothetical protein [Oceanibacterium hippocampi]|uniref:Phosphohydrolase n=1 Tax=Oceanibacterium hippocampi TaxID=745714 RepID=A0A1Y5TZU4_9PROT|nr:hypothetical protein [Oceanibacterium hippocampi]SLN77543.1 hypothetical protein OCH7691_04453 [Oceanibacterium hippocampi]
MSPRHGPGAAGAIMLPTGHLVDPFALGPGDIARLPLAQILPETLATLPRFGGCPPGPAYSVAQHCCELALAFANPALGLAGPADEWPRAGYRDDCMAWALLHEVFEALTGLDVPSPIKRRWPLYRDTEAYVLQHVCGLYGIDPAEPACLEADARIVLDEAAWLFGRDSAPLFAAPGTRPLGIRPDRRWDFEEASRRFRDLWLSHVAPRRRDGADPRVSALAMRRAVGTVPA